MLTNGINSEELDNSFAKNRRMSLTRTTDHDSEYWFFTKCMLVLKKNSGLFDLAHVQYDCKENHET